MGKKRLFPEKSADQLLSEFVQSGNEASFEEIVRRYAGMVYSVCYRVAMNSHDAEDATQAVFLSFALQAKTGKPIRYIGPWLGRVAHRVALDVKKSKTRRRKREEKLAEMNGNGRLPGTPDPSKAPHDAELKAVIQEELNAMPAKYRMPLILHYFGGMNREEMARELNCKPATLGVRVHRGRAMLGKRLARRGVAIGASLPIILQQSLHAAIPAGLVNHTASSVLAAAGTSHNGTAAVLAATRALALVRIAARAVMYAKIRTVILILLVSSLATALAAPTVIRSVKELHLHLVMPWDMKSLIRPLMRVFLPTPQANAQSSSPPKSSAPKADPQQAPIMLASAQNLTPVFASPPRAPAPPEQKPSISKSSPAPAAQAPPADDPGDRDPIHHVRDWLVPGQSPASSTELPVGTAAQPQAAAAPAPSGGSGSASPAAPGAGDAPIDVSTGHLTVGGGGSTPAHYIMPQNYTLNTNGTVIGASGLGYFHQSSGSHHVSGDLVLGRDKGSKGVYDMTGGKVTANGEVIGNNGDGLFHQSGGTNTADHVAIGNGVTGTGTYMLDGDGVLNGGDLTVGVRGKGTLTQNGGSVVLSSYSFGPYQSDYFPANAGTPATITVAKSTNSTGTFALKTGSIYFTSGQYQPTLQIGTSGAGTFQLGDARTTGAITEGKMVRTNLVVRAQPDGSGTLRGWGNVQLRGILVNNGTVAADGFGISHTLDLSHFSAVQNTIDNTPNSGDHGWIARNKGALALPGVNVHSGTDTYTWGESNADPVLDLINSVRFTVHDATYPGVVNLTLMSIDRNDIPTLPKPHHFIGVWAFDPTDIQAKGGFDFTIRYDDVMAKGENINESILKFWAFEPDGQWHRITDSSFFRDTSNDLIGGHVDALTYLGVSAPEPSAAILLLAGAGLLALRRRRRCGIPPVCA